jgi:hypothetical protein
VFIPSRNVVRRAGPVKALLRGARWARRYTCHMAKEGARAEVTVYVKPT